MLREGCVGQEERRASRRWMSRRVLSERLGIKWGMCPVGMWCLEAVRRVWRNWDSPVLQEEGTSSEANASSVSRVYESQSALRRFVKEMRGGWGWEEERSPSSRSRMGRWSEFRVVRVHHSMSVAIRGVAMERSGEVGDWEVGSLVGVSLLRSTRLEGRRESRM